MATTRRSDGGSVSIEALDQRVIGLETNVQDIERKLDSGMQSIRADLNAAIGGIHTKLDARAHPQWSVIFTGLGVLLTFCSIIGALAYWPITQDIAEIKEQTRNNAISRVQTDQRIYDMLLPVQRQVDRMIGYESGKAGRLPW